MCLRPRGEADKRSLAATLHYGPTYDLTSEFRGNAPKLCGDKQRGAFSPKLGFRGGHPRNLQGPLLECQNGQNGTRNAQVGQPGEAQAHINEHLKDHSDAEPVARRIACPLFTCSRWSVRRKHQKPSELRRSPRLS